MQVTHHQCLQHPEIHYFTLNKCWWKIYLIVILYNIYIGTIHIKMITIDINIVNIHIHLIKFTLFVILGGECGCLLKKIPLVTYPISQPFAVATLFTANG